MPLPEPVIDPKAIFEFFRGRSATELLTAAVSHFDLFVRLANQPRSLKHHLMMPMLNMRKTLKPMTSDPRQLLPKHGALTGKQLPSAVSGFLAKEEKEFYERSRLDKQNLIRDLSWSGQGLYDISNDRVRAVAKLGDNNKISIRDFFAPSITDPELINIFEKLRAPRHLFKFLYRVLVDHCSKYTDEKPNWQIQPETLQSTLALFLRDLESIDRKTGIG